MTVTTNASRYLKGLEYSVLWKNEEQTRICVNLFGYENALNDYWSLLMNASDVEPLELKHALCRKVEEWLKKMKE